MNAPPHMLRQRLAFLRRNRCGVLVAALCVFIIGNPVLQGESGRTVLSLFMVTVMVAAVWAIPGRRLFKSVLALAMVTVVAMVMDLAGMRAGEPLVFAATAALIGVVTVALLYYVLDWHMITADKVFCAVAAYVLIAFTFASLFSLLQAFQARAFHVAAANEPDGHLGWYDLMYFSFTVLTSTGFGEITPVTNAARSLIVIEQVLGVMYVAFLVARLANLYGRGRAD